MATFWLKYDRLHGLKYQGRSPEPSFPLQQSKAHHHPTNMPKRQSITPTSSSYESETESDTSSVVSTEEETRHVKRKRSGRKSHKRSKHNSSSRHRNRSEDSSSRPRRSKRQRKSKATVEWDVSHDMMDEAEAAHSEAEKAAEAVASRTYAEVTAGVPPPAAAQPPPAAVVTPRDDDCLAGVGV